MQPEKLTVYLTRRLEGRDQHIELLSQLFEESQVATVETADPALDFISFAQDCTDFWIINAVDSAKAAAEDPLPDDSWSEEESTNSLGLLPASQFGSSAAHPGNLGAQWRFAELFGAQATPTTSSTNGSDQTRPWCTREEMYRLTQDKNIAGFIYLLPSAAYPDSLHFQEFNIGVVLRPQWRGRGVGREALRLALDLIFASPEVHRVQAQLIDCYRNDRALTLFTRMGFFHEGTRRQGFYCPLTAEWRDVTTLALLAMDWLMQNRGERNTSRSAPKSLWDALFIRHQQEREELLRWEDRRPCRSTSLETIREGATTPVPGNIGETDVSDAEIASPSESGRPERPKRKLFEIGNGKNAGSGGDAYDASSSEYDSDYDSAPQGSPPKRFRSKRGDTNLASEGANILEANWSNADLDSPPDSTQTLAASTSSLLDEIVVAGGWDQRTDQPRIANTDASFALSPSHSPNLSPSPRFSLSPSLSPEPREGSVISVPPSELGGSPEPGYTTSESGSESSPSGWELVGSDDEFGH